MTNSISNQLLLIAGNFYTFPVEQNTLPIQPFNSSLLSVYAELKKKNIRTFGDLPINVDFLLRTLPKTGFKKQLLFCDYLLQTLSLTEVDSNTFNFFEENPKLIFFEDKVFTIPSSYRSVSFLPTLFEHKKLHHILGTDGISTYEDVPVKLDAYFSQKKSLGLQRFMPFLSILSSPIDEETVRQVTTKDFALSDSSSSFSLHCLMEKLVLHESFLKIPLRDIAIFFYRYPADGRSPLTLEETGVYFGITRERVRQILSKIIRKIHKEAKSTFISIEEELSSNNGFLSTEAFYRLTGSDEWKPAERYALFHLLSFLKVNYSFVPNTGEMHTPSYEEHANGWFKRHFDECDSIDESDVSLLSLAFAHEFHSDTLFWKLIHEQFDASGHTYVQRKRLSKTNLVRSYFQAYYPNGMNVHTESKELLTALMKQYPNHFGKDDARYIADRISNWEESCIIERGVWVAKIHLAETFNEKALRPIYDDLQSYLSSHDVQDVRLDVLFDKWSVDLAKLGIHSSLHLYSSLKECFEEKKEIRFVKPPRVALLSKMTTNRRSQFEQIAELFEQLPSIFSFKDVEEAFRIRGWKKFLFTSYITHHKHEFLRVSLDSYIHEKNLVMNEANFSFIVKWLTTQLSKNNGIFNIRLVPTVFLQRANILSHYLLHGILSKREDTPFVLHNFPYLSLRNDENDDENTTSYSYPSLIDEYAAKTTRPFAVSSLIDYFTERGYNSERGRNYLYSVDNLFYYEELTWMVHRDAIGLSKDAEIQVLDQLVALLTNLTTNERFFWQIDSLFYEESIQSILPVLENQIEWTPTLLLHLLKRDERFLTLGTKQTIVLLVENPHEIESGHAFLHYHLIHSFDGATSIKKMESFLLSIGFLTVRLTSYYLNPEQETHIPYYTTASEIISFSVFQKEESSC